MNDLLREFLTDTGESLDTVDNQLVRFEQEPNNAKILGHIFRLVHTIKGTCGLIGLPRLEALTHSAETLMGKFRDGLPVTGEAVTLILVTIDRIKDILAGLETAQAEPDGDDDDLIGDLDRMGASVTARPVMQDLATTQGLQPRDDMGRGPRARVEQPAPARPSLPRIMAAEPETADSDRVANLRAWQDIQAVVTDIDMPDMNGFEFAETIRADTRLTDLPIIALSALASPAAIERGRQAGFRDYVAKFDRSALIAALKGRAA